MNAIGKFRRVRVALLTAAAAASLSACAVGPDYQRPAVDTSVAYKENQGWTPASPQIAGSWTDWWSIYNDPILDGLEKQVDVSNQDLKAADAAYRAARAEVGVARSTLLPQIGVDASARETGGGTSTRGGVTGGNGTAGDFAAAASLNWDIDVWGRIRRTVEADVANAQASAADIAAARLSAQTDLAEDYFLLRAAEEQERLLTGAITSFQDSLQITQNRYRAGIATQADVSAAQTQIDNAQAQAVNVQLTRAKLEHAIATLIGKPPSEVTVAAAPLATVVAVVPAGVPSTVLERRPDIAAAEYKVAAANAQIGVSIAAWFPDLTLSGSYGFGATALSSLFSASNATWSIGPALAETIFDGGARLSQTEVARANFDESAANYRQTVLNALQQVEDELATLRILEQQATLQDMTVADARRTEQLTLNQYTAGVAAYTDVITAQTTRVNAEIAALAVLSQRLVASVDLVMALGGGWDKSMVPTPGFDYSLDQVASADHPGAAPAAPADSGTNVRN